jgi:hypothetical protein
MIRHHSTNNLCQFAALRRHVRKEHITGFAKEEKAKPTVANRNALASLAEGC